MRFNKKFTKCIVVGIKVCPHLIQIDDKFYWIQKARKEHPIYQRIKTEEDCHYCYRKIKH